ncbi:MAG: hypothetical protein D6704_11390 [Nitrospirae bacterium]|nr:MAG: hypothetical protein D6704_11390 [Nitrospirota bacterium]
MIYQSAPASPAPFRLLSAYTGVESMEEALQHPRAVRLLWLEILVNDHLDLQPWQHLPAVREAYVQACRWYTAYRTVLQALLPRSPLPRDPGSIDYRELRTFMEALRFVAAQS